MAKLLARKAVANLIVHLDRAYVSTDEFFAEIVGSANSEVRLDDFGNGRAKRYIITAAVQRAQAEGWLPGLLGAVEDQLKPPHGRFREEGQRRSELEAAIAAVRNKQALPGANVSAASWQLGLAGILVLTAVMWWLAKPRAILIASPTADFRVSHCGAGWQNSPVAVTLAMNYRIPRWLEPDYVEAEKLVMTFNGQSYPFDWARLVEHRSYGGIANCLGEKGSVGPFRIADAGGTSREVMFFQTGGSLMTWLEFATVLATTSPGSIEIVQQSVVSGRTLSATCLVDSGFLKDQFLRRREEQEAMPEDRRHMVYYLNAPCQGR